MDAMGIVLPDEGLRVRSGPGLEHSILGALAKGESVALLGRFGDWWGVQSRFGTGFAHGDFIAFKVFPESEFYVCADGDTLSDVCARFELDLLGVAALNNIFPPFPIHQGLLLRMPLPQPIAPVAISTISVLNPLLFDGQTLVTSSSLQGHHRPYLGACSCDLDIIDARTPGTHVRLNVAGPAGVELRGSVIEVGLACRSGVLSDGGRKVKLAIQTRQPGGDWTDTHAWVLYGHLDPLVVRVGDLVNPGDLIGALGPNGPGEYDSSCARGSHIHVEATKARCLVNEREVVRNDAIMSLQD